MSDGAKFVGEHVQRDFECFWDYVNEVRQYAIKITEDCSSFDDLPAWNRMLILAYCAATWDRGSLEDEVMREHLENADWVRRTTKEIETAHERAALKRKIRSLQKQLARAKEKAKTKKTATINKE